MLETSLIRTLFRSLRHKNFRLFFSGQLVSLIGTWMQNVGQAWLALDLTHSSLKLGIVSALQFAPMLFLSFPAGVFIDSFLKRKIIIGMSVSTFTFGGLTPFGSLFAGSVAHWIKTPLTFALGGLVCGIVFLLVIMNRKRIPAWRSAS